MSHINFEVKAKTEKTAKIKTWLLENGANPIGVDHQIDTYFCIPANRGRLKLRTGNIENSLIQYNRSNEADARISDVAYSPVANPQAILETLSRALGVHVVVDKTREIFFIDNVKFHLDYVDGLGHFVEIEAIAKQDSTPAAELEQQCRYYMQVFEIDPTDIQSESYSDMILRTNP
jgi:predicted adenylyl cyclase CyaB